MNSGFDPEVPSGYQDADLEMIELADRAKTLRISQVGCMYCPMKNVGLIEAYGFEIPYCNDHESLAKEEAHWRITR